MSGYSDSRVALILWLIALIVSIYMVRCEDNPTHPCMIREDYIAYSYPKQCDTCGTLNQYQCGKCVDCGYCVGVGGKGECVQGDANGPFFRDDCIAYKYHGNGSVARVYPEQYYWNYDRYDYAMRGTPWNDNARYSRNQPTV